MFTEVVDSLQEEENRDQSEVNGDFASMAEFK